MVMVKAIRFIEKKMAIPSRTIVQRTAPSRPRSSVIVWAILQPKQQ